MIGAGRHVDCDWSAVKVWALAGIPAPAGLRSRQSRQQLVLLFLGFSTGWGRAGSSELSSNKINHVSD